MYLITRMYRSKTRIFSSALLTLISSTLLAEELIDYSMLSIEQLLNVNIVAVASNFQESNLDTASVVESIDRSDWRVSSAKNLNDVIETVPGVHAMQNAVGTNTPTFRGMVLRPGESGISTLFDGVPLNGLLYNNSYYQTGFLSISALEKVEMIRGPGSALYGSDSFQGVLALHSRHVDAQDSLSTGIGGDKYRTASVFKSHRVSDKHRVSISANIERQDPQLNAFFGSGEGTQSLPQDRKYTNEYPSEKMTFVANSVFEPSTNFKIKSTALYNSALENVPGRHQKITSLSIDDLIAIEHDINFWLLQSSANFRFGDGYNLSGQVYYWDRGFDWDITQVGVDTNIERSRFQSAVDESRSGAKIQLSSDTELSRYRWNIGASFSNKKIDENNSRRPPASFEAEPTTDYRRETHSLFGELKLSLWELSSALILGGRYDDYSDVGQHFSPRVGLVYRPTNRSSIKVLYGSAFQAPTAANITGSQSPGLNAVFGTKDIKSETVDTYELIYMTNFQSMYLELVGFYSKLKDGILIVPMSASDPRFVAGNNHRIFDNSFVSKAKGIESKLGLEVSNYKIETSLTYTRSKAETAKYNYASFPKWMSSIDISYETPSKQTVFLLHNQLAFDAVSFQQTDAQQQSSKRKNYYRSDFSVQHNVSTSDQFTLSVKNMFNRRDLYKGTMDTHETNLPEAGRTLSFSYTKYFN